MMTTLQIPQVAFHDGSLSHSAATVRFLINGFELETSEATIRYIPETYLTWLVDNCKEDILQGRAIELKGKPKAFGNLIRRLSYLRENNISVKSKTQTSQCLEHRSKRRKAMDPGPIIFKATKPSSNDNRREICRISTPLPTHASDLGSSVGFAVGAVLEVFSSVASSFPKFFDRVVFLMTQGRTPSGSPLVWPYLFHLFNSRTSAASEMFPVHNPETSQMDQEELEALYQSVHISSKLQHQMKDAMKQKGYKSVFSDMRIDMNNFFHWRVARASDYGVRLLDNDCTIRCLVVSVS